MSTRTTRQSVTFQHPFILSGLDAPQPAGIYVLETDEEEIEGLSFSAYRRAAMRLQLQARPGVVETVAVNAVELERALAGGPTHER